MNFLNRDPKRVISVFTLVMINIIAIDSLRNVPAAAEYGLALIFYYLLAAFFFFVPTALVAAELATGWPQNGGIYIWIREAFGDRAGLLAIWLQWIENVIWYPTMMSFVAATLLYGIAPEYSDFKLLLFFIMLGMFWFATFLNIFGMRISGWVSTITAIFGTLLPMVFIIFLGGYWLFKGYPSHIHFEWKQFLPDFSNSDHLAFFTAVLLGLVGIELSATYAQEVKNPQKDYPKAIFFSTLIIMTTLILASLAIVLVVPKEEINLVDGLIQAFDIFFKAYGFNQATLIVSLFIVVGGFGGIAAWIIGPSKGLLVATQDHYLPAALAKTNRYDVPVGMLFVQGILFSALCSLFLFFDSINSSYWILSALAAQLYMLMYAMMFMAVIRLRYSHDETPRTYRIPGGKPGIWIIGIIGIIASFFTIFIGFIPPKDFEFGGDYTYEWMLGIGFILFCIPPLFIKPKHERPKMMIPKKNYTPVDLTRYRTFGLTIIQLMLLIIVMVLSVTFAYSYFFGS